jgi:thiol-disulfide isomerase/thioredoxin
MAKRSRRRSPPPPRSRSARPATPPPPSRSARPATLVVGLGALVIAGAAIAAIALTQLGSSPAVSPSSSPTPVATAAPVAGVPLPPFVDGIVDPAVGQPLLEFDGADFDGNPVGIRADGRPKVLLFIAHWCPHCQREVPVVQDWIDANGMPAGVDLISVATSIDPSLPNYPPDAWLAREGWEVPVIVDGGGRIAAGYGLTAFPYWVVIDADGKVAARLTGELTPAQLDALVASVAKS